MSSSAEDVLPQEPVRVVALGASAGGLPALEEFMAHTPVDSGMAWAVVQHLDPTRETVLARILQRVTQMPVREAGEGQRICADTVYVIPPNASLTLRGGSFHVSVPSQPRGRRQPVNDMLLSLAGQARSGAIAVVLSGSGSDGAAGVKAIRAAGGLCLAQDPATAQFDGMPCAAIQTGCVDITSPPDELPQRLMRALALRRNEPLPAHDATGSSGVQETQPCLPQPPALQEATLSADANRGLTAILRRLQSHSRYELFLYKRSTLLRRIQRRMGIHHLSSLSDYEKLLADSQTELELLSKEMLVGVTGFFRDREVWNALQRCALPALLMSREDGFALRAWVAGCSTGEEAYTLAIVFSEVVRSLPERAHCTLQIFATDLSEDAIARARRGIFGPTIAREMTTECLARHFTAVDGGWKVCNEIREMVVFAPHDVNADPPFTRLDLLCCRNLLIYLTTPLQRRLMPLFHYSLRPGGLLVLGSSETVGRFDDLFETLDARLRLYRRLPTAQPAPVPDFSLRPVPATADPTKESHMSPSLPEAPNTPAPLAELAQRLLLDQWTPAAVLVADSGDIVFINGRTGRYLEPAAGKANWNVHVMARPGLRAALSSAIGHAAARHERVDVHDLPLEEAQGPPAVSLSVQPLDEVTGLKGMFLVIFRDVAQSSSAGGRRGRSATRKSLTDGLQHAKEETQSLREEMRASQEELQAANEELQSTNEELQSTNEELTSSKEELQSMNEELHAVNAELQAKLDDLAVAQSDMRNLLNSTDIATLFLDRNLHVRRFTERARKIISLRDSDVGRPLGELTSTLDYPALEDDVREMLRTLVPCEKHVRSRDGQWFAARILPYRTQDDVIDGAVLTFVDISSAIASPLATIAPHPQPD